jgi:D-aspartate ligase
VACEVRFPVVIKPPRRTPEWMQATGGFKVLRVDDKATLLRVGSDLLGATDELILQDWVAGGDDCMYSLLVCLDEQSHPATSCLVAHKIRQWPPDIGVGSLAEEVRADAIVENGLRLLQEQGYVGVGSLQWKRDSDSGKYFIIEMNARFTLGSPLFEACGVEATLSHYSLAAGLPLPECRTISHPGGKWICWKRDLASAYTHWKRGDLSIGDWRRSLRGRKRSADLWLSDPMPMLIDIGRKLRNGLSRSALKTLRGRR